jgi:glycerate kinase
MHILIAPNAFKNSLTAEAAAEAIQKGILQSGLECTTECFPIGDGGDGTVELIIKKCNGVLVNVEVSDPLGRKINTSYGLIDSGKIAIIEMAAASGLRLLKPNELDPMRASSYGTGEMIKDALDKGVNKIILAIGGSATVDGGMGILRALGIHFLNSRKNSLSSAFELIDIESVDTLNIDGRISKCKVVILCDVDNKLLGPQGAAAVFGPQKGAGANAVKQLDAALTKFSEVTFKQTGTDITTLKYGGAAGGVSAGLHAFLNAELVTGIDHFLELTGFDAALQKSNLVITGEGSIDEQTLQGKGPFGVAYRAKNKDIPVIGLAGMVPLNHNTELHQYFDILMPIGNGPVAIEIALANTANNLTRTATEIGSLLKLR